MKHLNLSQSSIGLYLECPASYNFAHMQPGVPKKTSYPRLMGMGVHQFIASLYQRSSDPTRHFWYRSPESAKHMWFAFKWKDLCDQSRDQIDKPNEKTAREYGSIGWYCIQNYWEQNVDKPRPIAIEKRYRVPIDGAVTLNGTFDQLRNAEMATILKYRPELIVEDPTVPGGLKLAEGYDPVFIVDLKTNKFGYDKPHFVDESDLLERAAHQFELQENLQVLAYHYLYFKMAGKMPAGFWWYHLRTRQYLFTWRVESEFPGFMEQIKHVVDGINSGSFPKVVGPHCKVCDYLEPCAALRGDRPHIVTEPADSIEHSGVHNVPIGVTTAQARQLRFPAGKFKVSRAVSTTNVGSEQSTKKPKKPRVVVVPSEGQSE